ncbi:type I restriction endonuclease subunit R [Enterococcus faecium]|uniref:type I restriction endonuclease subunit R n=1 Tax=Enterococcus faecium TaxID=1352 RepID=UPI001D0B2F63|nr:type I restriction endonuclease subunit R [Enterococcus faecium]MCB8520891.1 type I restriction endonuclease subunit R [Enterococcus faecium]
MQNDFHFTEAELEETTLEWLEEVGYTALSGSQFEPGGELSSRQSYNDVVLVDHLKSALIAINPEVTMEVVDEAVRKVTIPQHPKLMVNNRTFHKYITDGIDVETREGINNVTKKLWLFDFKHPENNEFLAINQFVIQEGEKEKRPDVILFVNGLPLVVIELKNATNENVGTSDAFNQLQTYKSTIPTLFHFNEIMVISDGFNAKAGTISSNEERFMVWRTMDGQNETGTAHTQLEVLIKGMLNPTVLLDLIRHFILFKDDGRDTIKILAAYHQYHAVNRAVEETKRAASSEGDHKIGVVWHTQGSGKSLSMVFYSGKLIQELDNPTIVVLTDRNDLDDQLFLTFSQSSEILRQSPKQAESREDLRSLLSVEAGGIVFTTMQKFSPDEGVKMATLTDRRNVIVMADEAHRSQYGFSGKLTQAEDNEYVMKYGYAKYLRDALPNASYIGFTGTPIASTDKSTRAVFGDYVDVYDMTQAVADGATVKIYYESRIIPLKLPEGTDLDPMVDEIMEEQEDYVVSKSKSKWSRLEAVAGAQSRLETLAKDFVEHFEERQKASFGKSMIVTMSRRIAIDLYKEIVKLRPNWHSNDDDKGRIKIVMTGSSSDPESWQPFIGNKARREKLANRMKDNDDPLQIVIVRDMWLTGFDVPAMNTMYLDKQMKGHNLMQAIARVNRVFKDKEGGLIVDYVGIADSLKEALQEYTPSDQEQAGVDVATAVNVMLEKYDLITELLYGTNYESFNSDKASVKMQTLNNTMDYILGLGKKQTKLFKDLVTELSKAFALCATEEAAQEINAEVAFFKAVKVALMKLDITGSKPTQKQVDEQLKQLLSKSVVAEGVVDIYESLGLEKPDLSILSDEFLAEVRALPQKNVAVTLLERLLRGKVKSIQRTNLVQSKKFTEMLNGSIDKYNKRTIETSKVIEELIQMAKEMSEAVQRGEDLGLSRDEIAFYDALADHETAKEVLGDDTLKAIAHELTVAIKNNMSVDWSVRESARAKMRVTVRRLLKKYGYPPDLQKMAVDKIVQQAELMAGSL